MIGNSVAPRTSLGDNRSSAHLSIIKSF